MSSPPAQNPYYGGIASRGSSFHSPQQQANSPPEYNEPVGNPLAPGPGGMRSAEGSIAYPNLETEAGNNGEVTNKGWCAENKKLVIILVIVVLFIFAIGAIVYMFVFADSGEAIEWVEGDCIISSTTSSSGDCLTGGRKYTVDMTGCSGSATCSYTTSCRSTPFNLGTIGSTKSCWIEQNGDECIACYCGGCVNIVTRGAAPQS